MPKFEQVSLDDVLREIDQSRPRQGIDTKGQASTGKVAGQADGAGDLNPEAEVRPAEALLVRTVSRRPPPETDAALTNLFVLWKGSGVGHCGQTEFFVILDSQQN